MSGNQRPPPRPPGDPNRPVRPAAPSDPRQQRPTGPGGPRGPPSAPGQQPGVRLAPLAAPGLQGVRPGPPRQTVPRSPSDVSRPGMPQRSPSDLARPQMPPRAPSNLASRPQMPSPRPGGPPIQHPSPSQVRAGPPAVHPQGRAAAQQQAHAAAVGVSGRAGPPSTAIPVPGRAGPRQPTTGEVSGRAGPLGRAAPPTGSAPPRPSGKKSLDMYCYHVFTNPGSFKNGSIVCLVTSNHWDRVLLSIALIFSTRMMLVLDGVSKRRRTPGFK